MKRRLLFLLVLFASAFWTMAERIDVATARKIAESVAEGNSDGLRLASEPALIYAAAPGQSRTALRGGTMTGVADYFVFNFGTDQGFVIVSGDDRVHPVLGYSDEGQFDPDNLPENLRGMLASYQEQIAWAERQDIEATPEIATEWSRSLSGMALRSGGGVLLETTALWDQMNPYNAMCPLIDGQRALTGCGATSTAIIMRYHRWPTSAQNGATVHPLANEHPEWQCEPLDYSEGYNWDNMPLEVTGNSASEIAKLMWHIGANISMDYGLNASSSSIVDIVDALQIVFDYSLATRALQRDYYSEEEWEKMLIAELDAGRPVLYRGRTSNNEGHLFVCDGYNSNHYFRINWGWSGYKNNYFLLSALGEEQSGIYNYEQWMVVGMKRNEGEFPIYELHYEKEPKSSEIPLPVGPPFDLCLNFYSSASRTSSYNLNVAVYDIETRQFKTFLLKDNYYTLTDLQPNYGWFAPNYTFNLQNIQLTSKLKSSERLVVVYSLEGNNDWQILKGASDKYYAFDMNGLASLESIVEPERYTVDITGVQLIDVEGEMTNIIEGEEWSAILKANDGYQLPVKITVNMGGVPLAEGDDYSYDYSNGKILIKSVTGDIEIIAVAELMPAPTYLVTIGQLENLTADMPEGGHSVESGKEVTITLTASEGYLVPTSITLKSGDQVITEGYTYTPSDDYKKATLTIPSVTTNLQIYANAVVEKKYFSITTTLSNLTSDQSLEVQVEENTVFSFTLTPVEGYRLPDGIMIMNGQTPLTQGMDYIYDQETGCVKILNVTSNLTVQASAIDDRHFGVVFDLEGVTNKTTAKDQYEINSTPVFNLDLNAADGYDYDGSITVKMGEQTLKLGTDYEYEPENDHFALKVSLTETLTIIAKGTKKQYSVTLTAEGLTSGLAEDMKVAHGDDLTFVLIPAEGYELPEAISVSINGTTLSEGYTYSRASGEVTIQKVTGNVAITAKGILKSYVVTFNLTGLSFSGFTDGTKVTYGSELTFSLISAENYDLPMVITITMGGTTLSDGYTYDRTTGEVTIQKVTGDVEITAKGAKKVSVTTKEENVTIAGNDEVLEGDDYQATITPATGYKLPYAIDVYMSGRKLTVNQEYVYSNGYSLITKVEESLTSGEIRIWNVTGPIEITAKGVEEGKHEVILNLKNLSSDKSFEPQEEDSKIELALTPYSGYELPSSIIVTMGDKALAAGTDYTYVSGKFTLERITGLLIITAVGEEIYVPEPEPEPIPDPDEPTPITYTVTLPVVEGAVITAQGSTSVEEGNGFSFTVDVKEGYTAKNMVVKANGTELLPDVNGRYTITNVRSNIIITVTGIEEEGSVSIESVASTGVKVWAADGYLHICMPEAGTIRIISMNGKLHKILTLPVGETVTAMPQGVYIVRIADQSYKLRF